MKFKESFHPYAMATILLWSFAYVGTTLALESYEPLTLGFLRYVVASVVMLVYVLINRIKPPRLKDWIWIAVAGGCAYTLYTVFFNIGTGIVGSSTSSIVIATTPIITALIAQIVYGQKLRALQWIAAVVQLCGIALFMLSRSGAYLNVSEGVLWLLIAAAVLSVYNVLQTKLTKSYTPTQVTAYSIFAGTIFLTAFSGGSLEQIRNASLSSNICLVILGVFSSAVAYVFWAKAFSKAKKTASVSNYMFVTPLIATLLAYVIAGEEPHLATVAGGAIVLAGMLLFFRAGARE